jgi:hypothetical protein
MVDRHDVPHCVFIVYAEYVALLFCLWKRLIENSV